MAVVSGKSDLYRDVIAGESMPDPILTRGVIKCATGAVANLASDSSGSMYLLAHVPSHAIMHESTLFDVQSWGFAQVVIGSRTETDVILDVAKSAANTQSPFAVGDANHGKRLWEVLGLSEDPGGEIGIYAHAEAGAAGAGSMQFRIAWVDNPGT